MNAEQYYKYIIYKIFTSKYKNLFIIDGSYGLYLTVNSKNKRKLGDLDLNEINVSDKELNWDKVIKMLKEVFNKDGIQIVWNRLPSRNVREYNQNSTGSKVTFIFKNKKVTVDLSIIFNDTDSIDTLWYLNDYEFINHFKINHVSGVPITIHAFRKEKYYMNKILSVIKETNYFELDGRNVDISKGLYDVWFIVSEDSKLDLTIVKRQLMIMYKEGDLTQICTELLDYVISYQETIKRKLQNYIKTKSYNKGLNSREVVLKLIKHLKGVIKREV